MSAYISIKLKSGVELTFPTADLDELRSELAKLLPPPTPTYGPLQKWFENVPPRWDETEQPPFPLPSIMCESRQIL